MDFKFLIWLLSGDKQPSYKYFPAVVAFSLKFSIPLAAKLYWSEQKSYRGAKNGTDLLYHHAKYGGDRGSHAGCRRKSVMFYCLSVCLSRFGIAKFVITETLWSSVIFKTIMVPLHRWRFLVVHLYSSFSMDSMDFFLRGKFIPKIAIFGDFGGRKATFIKPQRWKLAWLWALWGPGRLFPTPIFVKLA